MKSESEATSSITPGPWYVTKAANFTNQHVIASERSGLTVAVAYQGDADALVIGCVPELLEGAREAVATAVIQYEDNDPEHDCTGVLITHEAYSMLLEALVKAKGGEQ